MLMLNVEVIPGTIGPHSHKPRVPHRPPATHKFFFCIILSTHVTGVLTLGTCAQRRVRKAEKFLWMWCLMSVSVWSDSQCLSVDCVVCACGVCSMVIDRVYSLWCLMPDARALSGAVKAFLWLWCREKKSTCIPEKKSCITCIPEQKNLVSPVSRIFCITCIPAQTGFWELCRTCNARKENQCEKEVQNYLKGFQK